MLAGDGRAPERPPAATRDAKQAAGAGAEPMGADLTPRGTRRRQPTISGLAHQPLQAMLRAFDVAKQRVYAFEGLGCGCAIEDALFPHSVLDTADKMADHLIDAFALVGTPILAPQYALYTPPRGA